MDVEVLKCPSCGAQITKDTNFCSFCGSKLVIGGQVHLDPPGIYLTAVNHKKLIQAIKTIRHHIDMGLKQAKDIVEAADAGKSPLISNKLTKQEAEALASELLTVGAKAELR